MHIRHHRPIPTELGKLAQQVRFSLKETQTEFAKRFMVSWMTIHNWESGKSKGCNRIHMQILLTLRDRLEAEGRLLPKEVFETLYRQEFERKNDLATIN